MPKGCSVTNHEKVAKIRSLPSQLEAVQVKGIKRIRGETQGMLLNHYRPSPANEWTT